MPRHRKESVSRHGACVGTEDSSRHAAVSAATSQAEFGEQDGAATVPMTAIGADTFQAADVVAAWGETTTQEPRESPTRRAPAHAATAGHAGPGHAAAGRAAGSGRAAHSARAAHSGRAAGGPDGPGSVKQQGILRGAARGLLVTPWFAAGTGFVVAAGVWILAPHALLLSNIPGGKPCTILTCGPGGSALPFGHGSQAGGHTSKTKASAGRASGSKSHATSGLTFRFKALQHAHGRFAELITITGKRPIESWRLSFVIRGAHITYVQGGWLTRQPRGHGVTVWAYNPQSDDRGRPNGGAPGGGYQSGAGHRTPVAVPAGDAHEVRFTVYGTGSPGQPVDCAYDGVSCSFSS